MRILLSILALTFTSSLPAAADGDRAGVFDYYVLALSWTPSWCAAEGDARDADQCDPGQGLGFTLHGLWPQFETGWPSWCRTTERDPSRSQTAAMRDIMGSGGLAWHQWKKHGRCSGLSARDYLETSRRAYEQISRPQVLRQLPRDLDIPPSVIEAAFLEANPDLSKPEVTVTCRDGRLHEVRICLTRDLTPRECGADVRNDCRASDILVSPMR